MGDLFQLAGEIFLDASQYTSAAHCYTLAAEASKESGAFDLWACALTRHSFIAISEKQYGKALPMLELAERLALVGDASLSTRHWVSSVRAQAHAGLGESTACERALDDAEEVRSLKGSVHNGGWLRFDGSRLPEDRGTCYLQLRRFKQADQELNEALRHAATPRRRACVMTDLATSAPTAGTLTRLCCTPPRCSTWLDARGQEWSLDDCRACGAHFRGFQTMPVYARSTSRSAL
jgi:hypothetical protein